MFEHPAFAAVSDRRRRSEIAATIYVALYSPGTPNYEEVRRVANLLDSLD